MGPLVDDELEVLARRLLDVLGRLTGLESTYLTRIRFDEGVQEVLVARNVGEDALVPEGLAVPWEDTLCKRAMDEGRWRASDVPGVWGDSSAAAALGLRTYVSVPVADEDGAVYGTLCGASRRQVELDEDVHALLEVLGQLVTLHLRQRAALAAMDVLAATDPLTGLANRRHLDDELRRRAAHASRGGKHLGLALFDLDGFKAINDRFGHEVGDEALLHVAAALAAEARADDLVGRWGGDELLVLLHVPAGDEVAPQRYVERVARRLAGDAFPTPGGPVVLVASAGVACSDGTDVEDALRRADAAMYAAKAARRT